MAGYILPFLWGVCIIQLQCRTGYAQYYESYRTPQGVSTFINQPITPINPYPKFENSVSNSVPTVDTTSYVQPLSSRSPGVSYTPQGQQQPFLGAGQSTYYQQQPSYVEYISAPSETPTVPSQKQAEPNFIYTLSNQGPKLSSEFERNVQSPLSSQPQLGYPTGTQYRPQTSRFVPVVRFTPNFVSARTPSEQTPPSEEIFPVTNIQPSLPRREFSIGGNRFISTPLIPKTSAPGVQSKQNSLETFVESLINKLKGDNIRANQIVINSDGTGPHDAVAEASVTTQPAVTTPVPVTEPPSPSPTPQAKFETTTPIPTTTTTTLPPPPPVHTEVITTEERHYVSKKKKITIAIRVEDASPDAVEKVYYSTSENSFYEWTKTILEPTSTYEETRVYLKNDTREVEGPSPGFDVTKIICRNFVDDKELKVVERNISTENAICPKPVSTDRESWEKRAFNRIESAVYKKLVEIFNITEESSRPTDANQHIFPTDNTEISGFLPQTLKAFNQLKFEEPRHLVSPSKRGIESPKQLIEIQDFQPTVTDENFTVDLSKQDDHTIKATPNQTSKRETKAEVIEKVNLEGLKPGKDLSKLEVVTEAPVPTAPTHIMLITRTPPIRPPNPYPHPSSTDITKTNDDPTKIVSLPAHQLLRTSPVVDVPSPVKENKETIFFRRST